MDQFLSDVLNGLSSKEKYLESKYFYDAKGDVLFQKIMSCSEYYPTDCEMEIFTNQTANLVKVLTAQSATFDVLELGAGDATKSVHLLEALLQNEVDFTYFPVDISSNVITLLSKNLPARLPQLQLQGLNGEYFKMLEKAKTLSNKTKVVLFLGGNIGNIPYHNAINFCKSLRAHLDHGDLLLIGFDLKKDPRTILAAYNDRQGFTSQFNLNLLHRINDELHGNFNVDNFYHYPTYDPGTGACKSYLVSKCDQEVEIADERFHFKQGEPIHTEISQKYTVDQTDELAKAAGFTPVQHFMDSKQWFLDTVWQCV